MEGRIIYKLLLILPFSSQGITPYDPCRGKEKTSLSLKRASFFPQTCSLLGTTYPFRITISKRL